LFILNLVYHFAVYTRYLYKKKQTQKFVFAGGDVSLTVGLGDTLQLILLLDGVRVGRALEK